MCDALAGAIAEARRGGGDGKEHEPRHRAPSRNPPPEDPAFRGPCSGRQSVEIENEIANALKPLLRSFFKAVAHDPLERWPDGNNSDQLRRLVVQDRAKRLCRRAAPKGCKPGEHFIKHDSEAEDIGPMLRAEAARLFG